MPAGICPIHPQQISQVKSADYIGLYLIVTASSCIAINWLYRIYL